MPWKDTTTEEERVSRMVLQIDSKGLVIPAEYFTGNGKKNYIAHISGRDLKYTWKRNWIERVFGTNNAVRYRKEAFAVGDIYEFHSSFLPTPENSSPTLKSKKFNIYDWRRDKMNRINSVYNGFWRLRSKNDQQLVFIRMYERDLNVIFPKELDEDMEQTTIDQFLRKGERYEL